MILQEAKRVQYAAATKDVRYYLNGIHIASTGSEIKAVASDGHRLAMTKLAMQAEPFSIILPITGLGTLQKLAPSRILIGSSALYGIGDDMEVHCKPIDAKYPDFSKIFKVNYRELRMDKQDMTDAFKMLAIGKDDLIGKIDMDWDDGMMQIGFRGGDGTTADTEIQCDGEKGSFSAKLTYMINMINSADGNDLSNAADRNPMILQSGQDIHIVMPMSR